MFKRLTSNFTNPIKNSVIVLTSKMLSNKSTKHTARGNDPQPKDAVSSRSLCVQSYDNLKCSRS